MFIFVAHAHFKGLTTTVDLFLAIGAIYPNHLISNSYYIVYV